MLIPILFILLAAEPALASNYPDPTPFFWAYPLLVSLVGSAVGWLALRIFGRRSRVQAWVAVVAVATCIGKVSVMVCLDATQDLFVGLTLWTVLIAALSVAGMVLAPSWPRARAEDADVDAIGPAKE